MHASNWRLSREWILASSNDKHQFSAEVSRKRLGDNRWLAAEVGSHRDGVRIGNEVVVIRGVDKQSMSVVINPLADGSHNFRHRTSATPVRLDRGLERTGHRV